MEKTIITEKEFCRIISCIDKSNTESDYNLIDSGSEGLILKKNNKKEVLKLYRPFYDKFIESGYNSKFVVSKGLNDFLTFRKKSNTFVTEHKNDFMVTANSLLYLKNFSEILPIGFFMDYIELDKKYPNFKKLRKNRSMDDIINLSILASDGLKRMHTDNVIHLDLHGKNFGVTAKQNVCLFDCDGCYCEGMENFNLSSTTIYYKQFMGNSLTKQYDKYAFSLMILQVLSSYYIRLTNRENISIAINNLRINNENLTNYFLNLLNPHIEQEYVGDVLKKVMR